MQVPALCDTCGAVYPSDIIVENAAEPFAAGGRTWTCPVCRGQGRVHEGVFDFLGRAVETLSAPERTQTELMRLVAVLSDASEQKQTPAEFVARINAEVPELAGLAALLPESRAGFSSHVSMLVGVSALVWQAKGEGAGDVSITVEQALHHIYGEMSLSIQTVRARIMRSFRRNQPCYCGSGKQFKRCCGRLA